ncbi:MAG: hypothetical protein WCD76_20480, partial [Pyrinomonadaceae bacterium]
MSRTGLHLMRVFAILVAATDCIVLAFLFFWLVVNGGYVECGKGVLNGPDWPRVFISYVVPPMFVLLGSIRLV